MKLKLKIFIIILALSATLPISAHDFQHVNSDGKTIYYNITSNTDFTVKVTYKGNSYNSYSNEYVEIVNIPSIVEYNGNTYSVTSIESHAFDGCSGLTEITIPNSVNSIGRSAFSGCSGLNEITIPNSVNSIGDYTFYGCSGLNEITIPNSVNSIGDYAFYNCSGLKDLIIEDSNETLSLGSNGSYGLFSHSDLETLYLGRDINYSYYPFKNIESLIHLTIGNKVTSIKSGTFSGCSGLLDVVYNAEDCVIEASNFNNLSNIKKAII